MSSISNLKLESNEDIVKTFSNQILYDTFTMYGINVAQETIKILSEKNCEELTFIFDNPSVITDELMKRQIIVNHN